MLLGQPPVTQGHKACKVPIERRVIHKRGRPGLVQATVPELLCLHNRLHSQGSGVRGYPLKKGKFTTGDVLMLVFV